MPKVLLWVVWLSLCFAHIVRLVMPYSKRLPLSRGYLIVRGRQCFQESFFWPIKVAVKSGIRHRKLPFPLGQSYYRILLIVELISPSPVVSKVLEYSVLLCWQDWTACTGQKYVQMLCISGWKWPRAAILTRFTIPEQRVWEQSFTCSVCRRRWTWVIMGWFYNILIKQTKCFSFSTKQHISIQLQGCCMSWKDTMW